MSDYERRRSWLRNKFDMTVEAYEAMLGSQENRCAICARTPDEVGRSLAVDHDHSTGEIRGLLCSRCNVGIGLLGDSIGGVMRAVSYLRRQSS